MRIPRLKGFQPAKVDADVTIIRIDNPKGRGRQVIAEADDGKLYRWVHTGLAYYLQVGYRGTSIGYVRWYETDLTEIRLTRVIFLHIDTKGPDWCRHPTGVDLLNRARQSPKDPLHRVVLADWVADQGGGHCQAYADCRRESLEVEGWAFPPRFHRKALEPLTGAFKGWPMGRMRSLSDDHGTTA